MKDSYLLTHISYHLHTFVRSFSDGGAREACFCARIGFSDEEIGERVLEWFLFVTGGKDSSFRPVLVSVNARASYAIVPAAGSYYVIGPVYFSAPVYLKYRVNWEDIGEDWFRQIPSCGLEDLVEDMLLVYNLHHEEWLDRNEILLSNCVDERTEERMQKKFSELIFEYQEEGKIHTYDQELREISSIEKGDPEGLRRSLEEDYVGEVGTLSKDPLRQARYVGIVVITLASRAAIRGGLSPEAGFSLSDAYIQKLDECSDVPTLIYLYRTAELQYAQMVRQINEQKAGISEREGNPHIHRCKNYIFTHLHEPIRVKDVAEELGIHANYLSELFHQCEKISLTDFIRREKIQLAKNLLIYSRYSYGEIAAYLGYSSQSHLGKQFKQSTGMTPGQFRKMYGRES